MNERIDGLGRSRRPDGARPGQSARPASEPVQPGTASQPGTVRVAAIDCGTNSLRLLIADIDPARGTLTDLSRRMEIVRLGQGVDATGRLAADALDRTFLMLAEYARAIDSASSNRGPDGRDQRDQGCR